MNILNKTGWYLDDSNDGYKGSIPLCGWRGRFESYCSPVYKEEK